MDDREPRLLKLVHQPDYRPLTIKSLARKLGVMAGEYGDFRGLVRKLVRDGKLELRKDKTLTAPRTLRTSDKAGVPKGTVVGTFRRNARGFGFVRPKGGPPGREADLFIPPDAAGDAASGDEVAVQVVRRSHRKGGNREGAIVRVVSRASSAFVGTYFEEGDEGLVQVDGTSFHEPLSVGDPGAKGAKPGDKVAVEIVRYPMPGLRGEAVVVEVLGPRGQPGVDTLTVLRAFGIPDLFNDSTLEAAREAARQFESATEQDLLAGRLDLRDRLTITIDPATARDFDDAITLNHKEDGFWELGVHIADVGYFVPEGSSLDREARERGTSVYLPDRVVPMLPEVISNSLASLQEGKVRLTMSVLMQFDPEGRRTSADFARSAIRVDRRFAYEDALKVMRDPVGHGVERVDPVVSSLVAEMLKLAMILRRRRFDRGALELVMPEVEIDLGDDGEVVGAHLAPDDESHEVIEEFMLAANEAVAEHLTARDVPFLRRVHDDPEPTKLKQFAEFATSLGYPIEQALSRFELRRVLEESRDKPERHAVHYGLLRSLKQATYTPERAGHYALASEDYCHFTSPIRRYPDLQVHRQLADVIAGRRPGARVDELAALAEHCTKTEKRAEQAERELIKIKLLTHLEGRIGEEFGALILGVEEFGLFAQLIGLPVDGLIHVTSLADDFYYLEGGTHTLVGRASGRRYRLGDRIEVVVARVDVDRRELDLVPADSDAAKHAQASRSREGDEPEPPRSRPPLVRPPHGLGSKPRGKAGPRGRPGRGGGRKGRRGDGR